MAQAQTPYHITILGGGTAGWMTAAALSKFLSAGYSITLIESEEIGTVGVGEATIPQIQLFHNALGIQEKEFMQATKASYKLGIEFAGWGDAHSRYMHAFGSIGQSQGLLAFHHYWLNAHSQGLAKPLDAYKLNAQAGYAHKMQRGFARTTSKLPPLAYAFHFDAGLYALFLHNYAQARGVQRMEGKVQTVARDAESGHITNLTLEDGRKVAGDFFIDCSGFSSLLLGKALGTGFEDWTHWLPCDRALAVACEHQRDAQGAPKISPYTRSTAHKAGWQWRIPLQHRVGNGIVYSSNAMSDEEAQRHLLGNLEGAALGEPRQIYFTTGKRTQQWHKNVLGIGLAASFLEPLESTSIYLIQSAIGRLLKLIPNHNIPLAPLQNQYNHESDFEISRIRDFIILHYWANQRPEPFWQQCRAMSLPDSLQEKLALYSASGHIAREHDELFTEQGWVQVLIGQGIYPHTHHPIASAMKRQDLAHWLTFLEQAYTKEVNNMPTHESLLAG
jgi:tryptophan 7-halogenase